MPTELCKKVMRMCAIFDVFKNRHCAQLSCALAEHSRPYVLRTYRAEWRYSPDVNFPSRS